MFRPTKQPRRVQTVQGDITRIPADAIVNAANSQLAGGGGVDGAIHRAGGPEIMRELDGIRRQIGHCPIGSAVVTSAGRLPAKFIFHTVGPVFRGGQSGEAELLASCYVTCLNLCLERAVASITFPSISTGVYGYPVFEAAQVAADAIAGWMGENTDGPDLITLVLFSASDHHIYTNCVKQILTDTPA